MAVTYQGKALGATRNVFCARHNVFHVPEEHCSSCYDELYHKHTPDPRIGIPPVDKKSDQAFKSDGGKPRFELLEDGCPNALLAIAKVLTWAVEVKGYHAGSWKDVPEAKRRYRAALARHRNAIARGEVFDPESGYPHWAHIACCNLFLYELEIGDTANGL